MRQLRRQGGRVKTKDGAASRDRLVGKERRGVVKLSDRW